MEESSESTKEAKMQFSGAISKPTECSLPVSKVKPFNIGVIQVYAATSNAEEAEVEWFYEDLEDLLDLTPNTYVLFIIGDWNAKVESQDIPGVTGEFGLGIQNEAGNKRLVTNRKRSTSKLYIVTLII